MQVAVIHASPPVVRDRDRALVALERLAMTRPRARRACRGSPSASAVGHQRSRVGGDAPAPRRSAAAPPRAGRRCRAIVPSRLRQTARYQSSPAGRQRQALAARRLIAPRRRPRSPASQPATASARARPTVGSRGAREQRRDEAPGPRRAGRARSSTAAAPRRSAARSPRRRLRRAPGERGAQVLALLADLLEPRRPRAAAPVRAAVLGHAEDTSSAWRVADPRAPRRAAASSSSASSRIVSSMLKRAPSTRIEVLLGERPRAHRRARPQTASAAARAVHPPANTREPREQRCSRARSRS